jgi:protein O-GlcNAc transferase
VLAAVHGSRLLVFAPPGNHRQRMKDLFATHGVTDDRVEFLDRVPLNEYMQLYNRIDIALDSFPYGGGITSREAVWMGVPLVSLAGRTAVGRMGLSLLAQLGLSDLVAATEEQYVQIATSLAGDRARLRELRAGLRQRMQSSSFCDPPGFARELEAAYRHFWQQWCSR